MREEGPPHPVLGSPLPTSPHPRQGELSSVPWIPPHKDLTLRFLSSKRAPPPPSSWGSTGVQSLALRSPRPLPVTGSRTPPTPPLGPELVWAWLSGSSAALPTPACGRCPAGPAGELWAFQGARWPLGPHCSSASLEDGLLLLRDPSSWPGARLGSCGLRAFVSWSPRQSVRPPPGPLSPCLRPRRA